MNNDLDHLGNPMDVTAGVVEAKRTTQVWVGLDVEAGGRLKCAEVAGRVAGHGEGPERGRGW